jgi:hypothetical protein
MIPDLKIINLQSMCFKEIILPCGQMFQALDIFMIADVDKVGVKNFLS